MSSTAVVATRSSTTEQRPSLDVNFLDKDDILLASDDDDEQPPQQQQPQAAAVRRESAIARSREAQRQRMLASANRSSRRNQQQRGHSAPRRTVTTSATAGQQHPTSRVAGSLPIGGGISNKPKAGIRRTLSADVIRDKARKLILGDHDTLNENIHRI